MSSEYNLHLHIPPKRKDLIFFLRMKKKKLSFKNNGSLMNKSEKFVKWHNRNITCQWKSLS